MTEVKVYVRDSAFATLSLIEPDALKNDPKRFISDDPQENKSELLLV